MDDCIRFVWRKNMAVHSELSGEDTIAAIATGITESGIGIIRVSGPCAFEIGEKLYRGRNGKADFSTWKSNTIHFGYIVDPSVRKNIPSADMIGSGKSGDGVIDEVMVSIMRSPHSYTTEDTIEINTHGGIYVMNRVLDLVLANGARLAEPGEFTKRAFLGGRIDLSKAEAVMDLISSKNEFARKTAINQLEGQVTAKIRKLREAILYETAFIESALDDPENYSLDGYPEKLDRKCLTLIDELDRILDFSRNGRIMRDGIDTVIVGKPNAGKSSLLNFLTGEERAIVTDVAGTTRDTLEESVRIGDVLLNVTDTAGIHHTEDVVEKIGVDRAKRAMESADLIVFLLDTNAGIDEEDKTIAEMISRQLRLGRRCIVLLNKSDLPSHLKDEEVKNLFRMNLSEKADAAAPVVNYRKISFCTCSLSTGDGMQEFVQRISEMFRTGEISTKNEVFLSNVRQIQEAQKARDALQLVRQSIADGMTEEFFSVDLMNAYTALGRIIGEAVEDDLVEEIFSKFCMGK